MKIADIMNTKVTQVRVGSTIQDAVQVLSDSQASDLVVVDDDENFVGVLSEGDLIRAALPRFEELLSAGEGLSGGIEMFVDKARDMADKPIDTLVIKSPIVMKPGDPVLTAASKMIAKQIRRLPVVDNGRVVGSVARADICLGVINVPSS